MICKLIGILKSILKVTLDSGDVRLLKGEYKLRTGDHRVLFRRGGFSIVKASTVDLLECSNFSENSVSDEAIADAVKQFTPHLKAYIDDWESHSTNEPVVYYKVP